MESRKRLDPSAWAIIFGFEDVEVTIADGSKLAVRVRIVRVGQAFYLLGIYEDAYAVLEYVCISPSGGALPEGWIDTLSPASHRALVKKARELNFPVILGEIEEQYGAAEDLSKVLPAVTKANDLKTSLTTAVSPSAVPMSSS